MIDINGKTMDSKEKPNIDFMIKEVDYYAEQYPQNPDDQKGAVLALLVKNLAAELNNLNKYRILDHLHPAINMLEPAALITHNINFAWDLGNTFGYLRSLYQDISMETALEFAKRKTALFEQICRVQPTKYNRLCLIDCYKAEFATSNGKEIAALFKSEDVFLSIDELGGEFYIEQGEFIYKYLPMVLTEEKDAKRYYVMLLGKVRFLLLLYKNNETKENATAYLDELVKLLNAKCCDHTEYEVELRGAISKSKKWSYPNIQFFIDLWEKYFPNESLDEKNEGV